MHSIPRISVLIPLYRGRNTIHACLDSLVNQQDVSLEILLLDNGCPEDTGEWAGYRLSQNRGAPAWKLLEEPGNIGFAAGMNKLYAHSGAPWVCFMNQDVELSPSHLNLLVSALQANSRWAGVCGTLLRSSDSEGARTIDTTGHVIFRDRVVRNRGGGKVLRPGESPQWPAGEVFGLSAACSLYRREALESAREEEGPFDPDFFAYFEDIDLDYRLHRAGWRLGYVPAAEGTHSLGGSGGRRELAVRLRAYGNRRRIMWKHESLESLFVDLGPIFVQEMYGFFRALVTDPLAWLIGPSFFARTIPGVLRRRARMDRTWGTDRSWIREWLRPERERWRDRA